jgi:hypothetical protein
LWPEYQTIIERSTWNPHKYDGNGYDLLDALAAHGVLCGRVTHLDHGWLWAMALASAEAEAVRLTPSRLGASDLLLSAYDVVDDYLTPMMTREDFERQALEQIVNERRFRRTPRPALCVDRIVIYAIGHMDGRLSAPGRTRWRSLVDKLGSTYYWRREPGDAAPAAAEASGVGRAADKRAI